MKLELWEGDAIKLGSSTVSLKGVRVGPFANREGKIEARSSATLLVDGDDMNVEEGSQLPLAQDAWRVVRIRRKNGVGVVRVALVDDRLGMGRFADAVEGFRNQSGVYVAAMHLLVGGVKRIDDVIERLDDHPDVVGTFADQLSLASRALASARELLHGNDAPSDLVGYIDRYLRVGGTILEVIASSTQEQATKRQVLDANKKLDRGLYQAHQGWLAANKAGPGRLTLSDEAMIRLLAGAHSLNFAELRNCVLALADFSFATVDSALFERCKLTGSSFSQGSALSTRFVDCEISDSDLRLLDLSSSTMERCTLDGSVAERSMWRNARVHCSALVGVELTDSVLDGAHFRECDLRNARLGRSSKKENDMLGSAAGATFELCDFRGADFEGRTLYNTNFVNCKFHGVTGTPRFDGAYTVISPDLSVDGDGSQRSTEAEFKSRWST
jgi:uncharacterized protein YjbI with pentapeptide repeats